MPGRRGRHPRMEPRSPPAICRKNLTCREVPTYGCRVGTDVVFASLANPVRRTLLELLAKGPRNAGELALEFALSRPAVSEHLRILEDASLVRGVKRGRERIYHLNPAPLGELNGWLSPFEQYWRDRLSDLAQLMEETQE